MARDLVVEGLAGDAQDLEAGFHIAARAAQGVADEPRFEALDAQRQRIGWGRTDRRRGVDADAEHQAFGEMAQFPQVAGPVMTVQIGLCAAAEVGDRTLESAGCRRQQVAEQRREVFAPLTQRR